MNENNWDYNMCDTQTVNDLFSLGEICIKIEVVILLHPCS